MSSRDVFERHPKRKRSGAIDWSWLPPSFVALHILRHGYAMCGIPGTPDVWEPGQYWIGFTEPASEILAAPQTGRCVACFKAWGELHKQGPVDVSDESWALVELPPEPFEVLGIDPGFAKLGATLLGLWPDSIRVIHHETMETTAEDGDDMARLLLQAKRLLRLIRLRRPKLIAFESISGVAQRKEMTGKGNAQRWKLQAVCGMVIAIAAGHGIRCVKVEPASSRVAVHGRGKSRGKSKRDTREAVLRITGTKLPSDRADAAAVALGGYAQILPPATPVQAVPADRVPHRSLLRTRARSDGGHGAIRGATRTREREW